MWAILSDIHGNLEALQAVLADATDCGVERVICLGDTVGYGPDPLECVTLSMAWPVALEGNFEMAVLSDDDLASWTALAAARSVFWLRGLLRNLPQPSPFRAYLAARPRTHEMQGVWFVHGTLRNPLHEYLWPEDIGNGPKMAQIAQPFSRCCFSGHTHIPGIFIEVMPGTWRYVSPEECGEGYRLGRQKVICNVGSVGQPRDGDWRACFVLFDGELIRFRRVEYDVQTTVGKIYANSHLDNWLGDRLRVGR